MILKIKVPLRPFPTNQIKSVFRGVMLKSKKARDYEKKLKSHLIPYLSFKNCFSPDDALSFSMKVNSPGILTKQGKKSKMFPDWDNCIKFTQDIVFETLLPECDDSQVIIGNVALNFDTEEFIEIEIRKL